MILVCEPVITDAIRKAVGFVRPKKGERAILLAARMFAAQRSVIAKQTGYYTAAWEVQKPETRKFWLARARARLAHIKK